MAAARQNMVSSVNTMRIFYRYMWLFHGYIILFIYAVVLPSSTLHTTSS